MSIPVVPTPLTPNPPMIYGFRYTVNAFELSSFITFNVILLDQGNTPLSVSQVTLSGEDYANWGNSDQYVIDYICTTLGLTPIDPSTVSPDIPVPVPVPDIPVPDPETVTDIPVPVPVPVIDPFAPVDPV